jgi:uncharacterized membrane protein YfcA
MDNMATLAGISVVVGFVGSLIGLGGAGMLIPLLVLAGIPVKEAIASSMVVLIATSSGSGASYVRERIANVRIAMFLEMFTITGAIIGATITTIISPVYLYFFFAAFLLTSFFKPTAGSLTQTAGEDRFAQWLGLSGSYYDEARREKVPYQASHPLLGGAGMLVAGVAAGMLGIGAGAFKVTIQENILRIPPKVATTTSNFIIGMTALAGVSVYLFSGLLNLTLMAPMAIGTTIGSIIGSRVLNRINDKYLRFLFYIVVVYMIVQMVYKGILAI